MTPRKAVKVKVTEAAKWHVKGDIINENPEYEKVREDYFAKPETKITVKESEEKKEFKVENQVEEPSMDRVVISNDDIDDKERTKKLVVIFGLVLIIFGLLMIKF